jgi:hypothetical protein
VRRYAIALGLLALVVATLIVLGPFVWFRMHERSIVEELRDPVPVERVEAEGPLLADGTRWRWPQEPLAQAHTALVERFLEHGIEVSSEGRAIGLIRIHHWCGNDPIGQHVARVDLSDLLAYMAAHPERSPVGMFTTHGWNVSQWYSFEKWCGRDPGRIYD